jgi:hypothetical protein
LSAQVAWNSSNRVNRLINTVGLGKARNGIELKGRVIPFFETQSHRGTEKVATRRQTVVLQSTVDSIGVALVSRGRRAGSPTLRLDYHFRLFAWATKSSGEP